MLQLVAFAHAEASFAASCSRKRWLKTRSGMASVPAIQFALAFCRGMIAAVRQVADTAHGRIANCIAVRIPQLHQTKIIFISNFNGMMYKKFFVPWYLP
jgi:hypothetical protein